MTENATTAAKKRSGEPTPPKHRGLKEPWKPGQSGNPAGRPKGSRGKFSDEFINDFYADWIAHGSEAIQQTREKHPSDYLRIAASLLPKHLKLDHGFENMTEEKIRNRIAIIEKTLLEQFGTTVAPTETSDPIRMRPH